MPIWITLLEYAVKVLIWCFGHKAVLDKVIKYTPLPKDPNPPLNLINNPNFGNPPDKGGV
jgi:hypothetical protein